jgi:hypothetical protein
MSQELELSQQNTIVCKWCTKEMPILAKTCPYCGKLRPDIYIDKILTLVFGMTTAAITIIFYLLLSHNSMDQRDILIGLSILILAISIVTLCSGITYLEKIFERSSSQYPRLKTKWYFSAYCFAIAFLCVGPFAFLLVWFNPCYRLISKIVITVIVPLLMLFVILLIKSV